MEKVELNVIELLEYLQDMVESSPKMPITGKTIIEYKLDCQIEEACNLLAITDMSMIDIAFATGFTTSSYFSEMFKKKKGISPKEYRMTALKTSLLISDND